MTAHVEYLRSLGACPPAIEFADRSPNLRAAWDACGEPGWLAWLARRTAPDETAVRVVVGALAECARIALPAWEAWAPDNPSVRECIEACDRYARGESPFFPAGAVAAAVRDAARAQVPRAHFAASAVYYTACCDHNANATVAADIANTAANAAAALVTPYVMLAILRARLTCPPCPGEP